MGVELDVLTGHPEHELLFVATQVARAAGLKNPANAISEHRKRPEGKEGSELLGGLIPNSGISVPLAPDGKKRRSTMVMMAESSLYRILLRGHAPASEPFRKWGTEEVLPTIRKTGRYDAEESTNPIAQSLMDELKTLREGVSTLTGDVAELKALLVGMNLTAPLNSIAPPSPYIGTEATTVPFHYQKAFGRELMDLA